VKPEVPMKSCVFKLVVEGNVMKYLVLSPTRDPSRDPNLKWICNRIPIASNIVSIYKTHFGCYERYKPNLSIISPEDPFVERILF
jgi:hypothetical protein